MRQRKQLGTSMGDIEIKDHGEFLCITQKRAYDNKGGARPLHRLAHARRSARGGRKPQQTHRACGRAPAHGALVSLLDVIKGLLGIVPSAIEAGKQVAVAVKPGVVINPDDITLWHHSYEHDRCKPLAVTAYWCNVCQEYTTGGLCSEAVRRRNAEQS